MKIYSIKDFIKGDAVYHRSNSRTTMIVIGINEDSCELTCRWTDNEGKTHKEEFLVEELAKISDKPKPRALPIRSRNDFW